MLYFANFLEAQQAHERRSAQNRRVTPEGIAEVPAGEDGGRAAGHQARRVVARQALLFRRERGRTSRVSVPQRHILHPWSGLRGAERAGGQLSRTLLQPPDARRHARRASQRQVAGTDGISCGHIDGRGH